MRTVRIIFPLVVFFFVGVLDVAAAEVKVAGIRGSWKLLVDGKDFYIQGVGCGAALGRKGEDYLKLAKELGANCVRTWGTDQGTQEYLDKAWEYGLMVDAGIWLNWADPAGGISYAGESEYKVRARKEVLEYIERFKTHPAVLMWNVGNEVLAFSYSEEEKVAFAEFLEELIQQIHQLDPNHPVIHSASAHLNLKYLKEYVPSLDIIGMNIYCSPSIVHGAWSYLGINKPYVITEYGPNLPADSQRDVNGIVKEPGDYYKACVYRYSTEQIKSFQGDNLGGFVFHLGETTQESMTWWNINEGELKKQPYWAVSRMYTGRDSPCSAPKITDFILSRVSEIAPGEIIDVEVEVKGAQKGWSYEYRLSTVTEGVLQYYVNEEINIEVIGEGNKVGIKVPQKAGVYRLYCFVKDNKGSVAAVNKSISVSSGVARTEGQ